MAPAPLKKLDTASYHVAWICAVADLELIPALLMLDESHERPDIDNQYDDNTYEFGAMGGHNVVVATCPDAMTGQVNVGHVVGPLFRTFTAIRMTLLVGIGGGVPQKHLFSQPLKDVRLGDVVVGWPMHADGKPAVIYYDSGRSLVNGFQTTTQLNRPHMVLLKALPVLRSKHTLGKSTFRNYLERLQHHQQLGDQFRHPGLEHDLLFKSTYEHVGGYNSSCVDCDKSNLVERKPRAVIEQDEFVFHQGRVVTGNSVIQDGRKRDSISAQHEDVFCIDMEAAGVDINSNCLVIRGISDYADSHKSDMWRSYAAGKAVVFARELLDKIQPSDVKEKMASVNKHWLVYHSTNPDFTGRREVIDKIIKRITSEDARNEQRRFVLTGLGGQGKSEICIHVANEVRDRFWGIFWVDASTHNAAEDSFSEIAKALGCEGTIDAVRRTLSNLPVTRQWLLILDNADDPSRDYQMYLPSGNRGAILMTFRNRYRGVLATAGAHEEVDSLEEAECIQLLHKSAQLPEVAHDTRQYEFAATLVQHLGHHTLAILYAGSYMASTHCGIAEYMHFFRANRQRLLSRSCGHWQGQSRYDTVYATFEASIDFLESQEPDSSEETRRDALQLLEILSTFHYTSMPLDVLMDAWEGVKMAQNIPEQLKMCAGQLTAWHVARAPRLISPETIDARLRITDAVARLESLALVRTDRSGRVWRSVSMHPLVHGWAGDRQSQQARKEALRMAECIVALSYRAFLSRRPYHPQFVPHLKRLVELDVELVDDAAQCRCVLQICVQIAWTYQRMDLQREFYDFTGRIFQRLDLDDQKPTVELRELYRVFAAAVDEQGSRPAQAVRIFEAIARLDKGTLGKNESERLENMRNLGEAYCVNGQPKEAVALLRKVVKALQKCRTELEDRDLLKAKHSLGQALLDGGQTTEAITLLSKVVMIRQSLLSEDNPDRLASQEKLAAAYLHDGQFAEATRRFEELAWIRAQTLGKEHSTTAITQAWLAGAYKVAGRFSDAIALFEQVINTETLVLGERHPKLLTSQHNLARAYSDAGNIQKAIVMLERVVHISNLTLDDRNQHRLSSQHDLARLYLEAGGASKSVDIFQRAVDITRSIYEEIWHPNLLEAQNVLSEACLQAERVVEAIRILKRVVGIRKSMLEEKDPDLLASQHELDRAYSQAQRVVEAIEILEPVDKIGCLWYDRDHPTRAALKELLRKAYAIRNSDFSRSRSCPKLS